MSVAEQLYLLQQIYSYENSYYDTEENVLLHRISSKFSPEDLKKLKQCQRLPNQVFYPNHDEVLQELLELAGTWTLYEAADAFIAGLWSAPFLWQSALTAKLLALVLPVHEYAPISDTGKVCTICGFRESAVDTTLSWYNGMTQGTPLDGDPVGHVLSLREMAKLEKRKTPTEFDLWTFRAILTVIRSLPPKSRYSNVRDALWREKLLPTKSKYVYGSLLESLAFIGVLDTKEYPGMATQFTTYWKRDERPSVRVEPQAPLAWWDTTIGVNEATLEKVFAHIDCSLVSLSQRPTPTVPYELTVTGQLEQQKKPRKTAPKSPDAGKGPVEAKDVYAVRVRDDMWVTVYCHRIEGTSTVVEYLDGVYKEMPMKAQLSNIVRLRTDGSRWQMAVTRIDKTTGVRRVARNIPAPLTDLPEPDRFSWGGARELKFLANGCFPKEYYEWTESEVH